MSEDERAIQYLEAEIERLRAENERLRVALQAYTDPLRFLFESTKQQ